MENPAIQMKIHSDVDERNFHTSGLWEDLNIVDHLDRQAIERPDKIAIVESDRTFTYAEVVRASKNVAASLVELGVGAGDVVAIQAPNWAELPIVHFATNRIGAIFVPLSEGFREKEMVHLLNQSKAKVVFCAEEFRGFRFAEFAKSLQAETPHLDHVISMRAKTAAGPDFHNFDAMAQNQSWRSSLGENWLLSRRTSADAPSHVMVSSGSTGLPKCSLYSDNNTLIKLIRQYAEAAAITSEDVSGAIAPAGTGSTGYNFPILCTLLTGGTSVLLEHWSGSRIDEVLELLEKNGCTSATVVPAQLAKIVQHAGIKKHDLSKLRVITNAGAKLLPSVALDAEQLLACIVQSCYGTSEAGATTMTCVVDSATKRHTTVGKPVQGQQVFILNGKGESTAQGVVGEVCWKGANKSFGFLNDDVATRKVWDSEGLFHSGDLGKMDDEGYLHIVGRKKDMIIRGGQNVNPGTIEEVLLTHGLVSEVAVVGVTDAVLGERIAACITARGQEVPHLDSLKALVRGRGLAAWNQPEILVVLDELPKNAGGKIDKRKLSDIAAAQMARTAGVGIGT